MGMPSGARVPVAAMENTRSKGSRKGSNLITVIAASSSCDVSEHALAGGDHATSPKPASLPRAAHLFSRQDASTSTLGGEAGLTGCRAHRTALLRWRGQIGHLSGPGISAALDLPEDQPNPGIPRLKQPRGCPPTCRTPARPNATSDRQSRRNAQQSKPRGRRAFGAGNHAQSMAPVGFRARLPGRSSPTHHVQQHFRAGGPVPSSALLLRAAARSISRSPTKYRQLNRFPSFSALTTHSSSCPGTCRRCPNRRSGPRCRSSARCRRSGWPRRLPPADSAGR